MTPTRLRTTGTAFGLLGAVAFIGDAMGGPSPIVFMRVGDAIVALVGCALLWRRTSGGLGLVGAAGLGSLVAMFGSTLLEIGMAVYLLGAATAAGLAPRVPARARNQG